jgi:hypothetical protein
MKKILFSLFALSLFSLGSSHAEEQVKENPEELFFDLYSDYSENAMEWAEENIPSAELLSKNKTEVLFSGNLDLSFDPQLGGGNLSVELKSVAEKDVTNPEKFAAVQKLSLSGELKDTPVQGNAKGEVELRIVDKGIYASLQSLEINSAAIPEAQMEQFKALIDSYKEKWYGNTFKELNQLTGGQLDIEKLLTGKGVMVYMLEAMKDEAENPQEYLEFVSLKTDVQNKEEGVYYFEVKMKPEKATEIGTNVASSFGLPSEVMTQMEEDMKKAYEKPLIIGLNPEDKSYVFITFPAQNIETGEFIEGVENFMVYSDEKLFVKMFVAEKDYLQLDAKDGEFVFSGEMEGEAKDLITGTYSDKAFAFEFVNPDGEQDKISGIFAEKDDKWSGKITNTMDESIVVNILNAFWKKESAGITVSVQQGEKTLGDITFTTNIAAIDGISTQAPASPAPFQELAMMSMVAMSTPNATLSSQFADTPAVHKNFAAINFVQEKGIVKGYEIDGNQFFKPENPINRAEFMKIVLLAKYSQDEIDAAKDQGFADIPDGEWYRGYANFGKEKGFIGGYKQEDGSFTFGGNKNINFAEAAKIIVNILIEPTEPATDVWYTPFIEKLQKKNVETYLPNVNLTRGEMAEVIYGVMK